MDIVAVTVGLAGAIVAMISAVIGIVVQLREKRSRELTRAKSITIIMKDGEGNVVSSQEINGESVKGIERIIQEKT
jgi:hypothetical protein